MLAAGLALAVALVLSAAAQAADPAVGLSEAEAQAARAEAEIAAARDRVGDAQDDYRAARRAAAGPAREARQSRAAARDLRAELVSRQRQAEAEIARLEEQHRQEEEDRDREVGAGVGFGLAALVGVAIAVGWRRLGTSSGVRALADLDLGRALGLCLGGGLLLLVVGGALGNASGVGAAIGSFALVLGLLLPISLLFARHSARVRDGRAKPALAGDRAPGWTSRAVAALFAVLALVGFGAALFAESPQADLVSDELRAEAEALSAGPDARLLEEAEAQAEAAEGRAAQPLAQRRAAGTALRRARGGLSRAEARLASAEADERRYSNRLVAQQQREEEAAAEEAERAAQEAAEQEEEDSLASGCDPNYTGCVPPYPPDVNCNEVGETVTVVGSDPHGLDADGDLVACE